MPAALAWATAWWLTGAPAFAGPAAALLWAVVMVVALAVAAFAASAARRKHSRPAFRSPSHRSPFRGSDLPAWQRGPWQRAPWWRVTRATLAGTVLVCVTAAALLASLVAVAAAARLPAEIAAVAATHSSVTARIVVRSVPVGAPALSGFGGTGADTGAGADTGSGRIRFSGTLVAVDAVTGRTAAAAAAATGAAREGRSVPVLVFASGSPGDSLRIGATVRVDATLVATEPGDAAALLVFALGRPVPVSEAPWWLDWADALRSRFAAAAATLPGDGGALLPGLAIGDTSAVGDDLDAAMKSSALSHLTAVSGANCAVLIAIIMLLGGRFRLGRLRLGRGARITLSLAVLLGFVVLVTPEPSVLRAAVMAAVLLIGVGVGRPGRGVPLLALSVIVLLATDPWLSRSYGFALSVLATGGLLVLAGPLTRSLARWLPTGLAALIAIPLAAQLACQPVLVLLSPTFPLYGVPANLLAEPAAPLGTVLGLAACLLLGWLPGLASVVLWTAWVPSAWIAAVARTTAGLPGSSLPWPGGPFGVAVTAVLTAAVLVLFLRHGTGTRKRSGPGEQGPGPGPGRGRDGTSRSRRGDGSGLRRGPQRMLRRILWLRRRPRARGRGRTRSTLDGWSAVALVVLVLFVGGYAGTLIGQAVGRALTFPADWQIAACDIGQGDAVVVRDHGADRDRFALVDVGPDPKPLQRCLRSLGIDRIDLLVLTHYDMDHIGGIAAVIGRVGTALVGIPENAQDERLHARLAEGGAEVRQAAKGDAGTLGGLRWDVLWPVRGGSEMQTGNPGSVTIEFDGRGIRSVFLGDLGEDAQDALDRVSAPGRVDVVKVAHHGSRDQSPPFYAELHATVGLISVGAGNRYGHPTASLLDLLRSVGTLAVRTDRQGLSVVAPASTGGGALAVWTEKGG
ncbi:ComEC/Rec2 family competence protein [Cryobacterium algoricola]|uniref:ComEC/Rec2 family competence protein n=1 Tax=Cryobacterium algoricola TaxID=1259183 RepID=A0ABY2IH92_9MICO|nr:ComEC/Rec2 family competence protein [Cryobacterium algoricola]TFB88166.1 ComEC/Rec2 family competence protein [Cryobacterium algoricola]